MDRKEARKVCDQLQSIADKARKGRLTEDRAWSVIESSVRDVMESIGAPIDSVTIEGWFNSWRKDQEQEKSAGTFARYTGIVDQFLAFLGPKKTRSLAALQTKDIDDYRGMLIEKVSSGTVNTHLKVLRIALKKAMKRNYIDKSPASNVDNLDRSDRHSRRAFTRDELKKLFDIASSDWRTMIIAGLYTGQRLGDVANLTWANVDLSRRELTIASTEKTDATIIFPIAKPLAAYLEQLPTSDDPQAPLSPGLFGKKSTWLSNQFYDLMAAAGLVSPRKHQKHAESKGRGSSRVLSAITFHALRHTATSLLKNAGVSDVVAMDLIGHESQAVSRNYTHIDDETKRAAVDKMPDILDLGAASSAIGK